jgi:MurNAc alpha-1-phosphate uridylyltransferase
MRAMILAAGRGERMRPLTDTTPKPLLKVAEKSLLEYHLEHLVAAGFIDIVINLAYLGGQIEQALGDGHRYGARLHYSHEGASALETGGGILKALPLLGNSTFVVVNGDIWCNYPLAQLRERTVTGLAHLVLVNNPEHHLQGDFHLEQGLVTAEGTPRLTFSGIGIYQPALFQGCQAGRFALAPLLIKAMQSRQVSGEHFQGLWMDIGTPQRLQQLDQMLLARKS